MDHPWIYTMDSQGETPATRARKSGYTVLAEMLLSQERKAMRVEEGVASRAPTSAAYWGMAQTVRKLVADERPVRQHLSEVDQLLHDAAREGDIDQAQQLLDQGADPNLENELGLAPLHWSALNGRADMAEVLIEHGAEINAREHYTGKLTPTAMALLMGYDDLARTFSDHGGTC